MDKKMPSYADDALKAISGTGWILHCLLSVGLDGWDGRAMLRAFSVLIIKVLEAVD